MESFCMCAVYLHNQEQKGEWQIVLFPLSDIGKGGGVLFEYGRICFF
jgi:hypothetical protein